MFEHYNVFLSSTKGDISLLKLTKHKNKKIEETRKQRTCEKIIMCFLLVIKHNLLEHYNVFLSSTKMISLLKLTKK
jgi:hypothetical protein